MLFTISQNPSAKISRPLHVIDRTGAAVGEVVGGAVAALPPLPPEPPLPKQSDPLPFELGDLDEYPPLPFPFELGALEEYPPLPLELGALDDLPWHLDFGVLEEAPPLPFEDDEADEPFEDFCQV